MVLGKTRLVSITLVHQLSKSGSYQRTSRITSIPKNLLSNQIFRFYMYLNLLDSFVTFFANNNAITKQHPSALDPFPVHAFNSWRAIGQCWLAIALLRPTTSGTLARCFRSVSKMRQTRTHPQVYASFICPFHPCFMLHDADELHLDVWHHLQKEQCIAPGTTFFTGANACVEGCLRVLATICDCSEITYYVNPHISTR